MRLSRQEQLLLAVNLGYLTIFGIFAALSGNAEFIFYILVVLFFVVLLLFKHRKLGLSSTVLWLLSGWGLLHMAGGNVMIAGDVLYNYELFDVLRYDKPVHAYGFGVTTIVGWELLKPYLKPGFNVITIAVLLVMVGVGAGALNEMIEFAATQLIPETNVGGYVNTSLDLVFNLIGAVIAAIWLFGIKKYHLDDGVGQ